MSRGKKLTKADKRRRRESRDQAQRQTAALDDFVEDTVGRFTCSTEIAGDFAFHCHDRADELDDDLVLARLAHEIWHDKPQVPLALALADLAAEEQRHRDALAELARRFDSLAGEQSHHHLDPRDAYRPLVRERLLSDDRRPPT